MNTRRQIILYAPLAIVGFGVSLCGCAEFFANQTASLGGDVAGERGTVRVLFINNTPHRAVFTYGTYDENNMSFAPSFAQFSLDGGATLDAGQTSSIAAPNEAASLDCARVFSIGSAELLRLIRANVPSDRLNDIDEDAMVEGVEFFNLSDEEDDGEGDTDAEEADDPDEEEAEGDSESDSAVEATAGPTSQGLARPFEARLGVDFPCNSLLIIRLEVDDSSDEAPFRVDFEMIPSESDR